MSFTEYWAHIPSAHRTLILVGGLVVFWVLEGTIPLFRGRYRKWRHAGPNLFFTLTTIVVNFGFAYGIIKSAQYFSAHHLGLLYLVRLPWWAYLLAGLLLLDLISSFLIHWIEHKVRWMWKFHIIHHTDRHVDTTTANRHHPGESVFRAVFTWLAVIVCGSPVWLIMLYQSLSVLFSQFNHANIRLPRFLDEALSWFVVSPDMHKVHHHAHQPYTDSNYGNIFSIWDRLFGTFRRRQPSDIEYGLDTHPELPEDEGIGRMLHIPFEPYRPQPGKK